MTNTKSVGKNIKGTCPYVHVKTALEAVRFQVPK